MRRTTSWLMARTGVSITMVIAFSASAALERGVSSLQIITGRRSGAVARIAETAPSMPPPAT